MNIKLTAHSETLLREYLSRAGYGTPEEVIEHALETLAREEEAPVPNGCSILELQGLGKEIWQGVDAQEYVDQERAAWSG